MKSLVLVSILLTLGALGLGGCSTSDNPGLSSAAHGGEVPMDAGQPKADAGPPPDCTLTQGYWKNHPEAWVGVELTIAGVTYDQAALLAIFGMAPRGDASLILAHQLIAALLNGGASDPAISATIAAALEWMTANADLDGELPFGIRGGSPAHNTATRLADVLAAYNEGDIGPGHCDRR